MEKGKEGMKADMDGVIASVSILESNMAAQGMALFTIASTEDVRVKIEVSPDDYEKLKIGNTVSIKIGKHAYQGTLTETEIAALEMYPLRSVKTGTREKMMKQIRMKTSVSAPPPRSP